MREETDQVTVRELYPERESFVNRDRSNNNIRHSHRSEKGRPVPHETSDRTKTGVPHEKSNRTNTGLRQ